MKRLLSFILAGAIMAMMLTGCQSTTQETESSQTTTKTDINVGLIAGPSGVGMANLMAQNDTGKANNHYQFSVFNSPDEAVAKITSGEVDIAAVPTNMAASLYNKTGKNVQMLAISTASVLYLLENGQSIHSISDLKGKTIYSTGQGANPEYILDYILNENGIDTENDVTIEFVSSNDELATLMQTGQAQVAMVPEPTVSVIESQNDNIYTALNIGDEWSKVANSSLLMGCVIANKDFVNQNEEAVKTFLNEYRTSIETATSQLIDTASLCEAYGIIPNKQIAEMAIPHCNLTYMDGAYMKEQIEEYFEILYAANPKSIGGETPGEDFYYQAS